ncbi:type II toxin-antitoxin system HicA family toxin [candidate division KSB1 bacterium]|nr:type II toxin-antitoxin system HicA family toxin [candidate division KSB1 bacterium]MCH8957641.1 type II toxin-antitoxin system HicA family toxin [candidate division KSB1 bacterium]
MAKLPIVKPKQVIAALERADFFIDHQTGSHARLIHQTESHRRVSVPMHNKDLKKGTLKNILRQAELSVEEFIKLL